MCSQQAPSISSPEEVWTVAFAAMSRRLGPCFRRSETRQRVQAYLRGLLSPVARKNGWQLAEAAGECTPYAMQYLLDRAVWESDDLRDQLNSETGEKRGSGANWHDNEKLVELFAVNPGTNAAEWIIRRSGHQNPLDR